MREPLPAAGLGSVVKEVAVAAARLPGAGPYAGSPSTHHVARCATLAALQRWRGLLMSPSISRFVARLAVIGLLVGLVSECADKQATSTTASPPASTTTTPTVAPTTTTVPPLSAKELAWLKAVTRLHEKMDKALQEPGSVNLTRAKMTSYANTLRACSSELARIGSPGQRLQPVYVIVKQACRTFDSGAKCWARAASVSMADGGVIAGSPEERTQARAIECGSAAAGNGTNLLSDAETMGKEMKARFG